MASTKKFGDLVIKLSLLTTDVEKQLKTLESKMKNFGKGMKSIGSGGLKLTGAITGMLAFPVKMAADLEVARAEFEALIGDATKADKLFSDMEAFALVSPLGLDALSNAGKKLLTAGVALDDIMPKLRQLGEVAGGNEEKLDRLALAFGQVVAKGRLMGQEANQMAESGFSPLAEISRTTGESMGELMARMEAGEITVAEVAHAFETATSAGGRFNGLLAKIAGTTSGKFNELKESLAVAIRPIGEALLPLINEYMAQIKGLIPAISDWIKHNGDTIRTVGDMTVKIGVASVALVAIGTVVEKFSATVGAARIAISFLYAHPVLAGLAAVAMAFHDIATAATGADAAVAAADNLGAFGLRRKKVDISSAIKKPEKTNTAGPANLLLGQSMLLAGIPHDIKGGSGEGNMFLDAAKSAMDSAMGSISQAAYSAHLKVFGPMERTTAAFEKAADHAEEMQRLQDDIDRRKIDAMEDGAAKEEAMIDLDVAIRKRELRLRGLLSDEMEARLDQLAGADKDLAGKAAAGSVAASGEGFFDTRNIAQVIGVKRDEELRQLKQIAKNTKPGPANGGIPVV